MVKTTISWKTPTPNLGELPPALPVEFGKVVMNEVTPFS